MWRILIHIKGSELEDIFLGDCAMTFPSHVVDDFVFPKYTLQEKYSLEFISTFWPDMVYKYELSFSGKWRSFCYDRFLFIYFFSYEP